MNKLARLLWVISMVATHINVNAQRGKRDSLPNVLIILTDDQGYQDVSYYGTKDLRTPAIDALVQDGLRFDNFYANAPVCSPTRASLMTGRFPDRAGVPGVIRTHATDSWGFLDTSAMLLPEMLRSNGYHTALIGKWHLGLEAPNLPNDQGFHYFHGWLGDMMDDYVVKRRHGMNYMRENKTLIDPPGHATDLFTQWSVNYIHEQAENDVPFFLYLAYNAPHFPVQPPDEWLTRVREREPGISAKRVRLVALIEHLDDGIGKVIAALKETGQYDNTLILFTSDNGGLLADSANNGPWRDGKQSVYEGGLRVPTGVVWKKNIQPGSVTDYRAMTMDIFATLADLIGTSPIAGADGVSFLPLLTHKKMADDKNRLFYFVRREGGTRYGGLTIQAVQRGGWKLLQNSPFSRQELYDLNADPYETKNLIEEYPEKYKELNGLLMNQIQQGGTVPWQPTKTK
ncbi:sulfatase family protein [Parapedobacter indicus]|uniref:Arylsulfatase A n=1 Tax=Parapedobacter indicus TaxID=1477437 RepID=A0A1I3LLG5_9SPHI|nr:sulfatase-like hydrolase/transferase [Parapedobacter indicus]PPL01448.1 arylsulfatase A-like enzyme [Parapedobacter indicus]SFI85562.1 Arylsulfatase A [Parapedobacter indicus]